MADFCFHPPVVELPETQCSAGNKVQKRRWGQQGTQTQLGQPKLILLPYTQQPMQPQRPAANQGKSFANKNRRKNVGEADLGVICDAIPVGSIINHTEHGGRIWHLVLCSPVRWS